MWYREGTITFTQGSNTLVGAGTAWNVTANGVLPGMIVIGPDNKLYEIKRVTSDTNIVLSEPYTGETQSEVPCRIITTYEGDLTQFSARFTALMSRMSADSKSIRSWLTALDEVTIEREDGTEVTVKPLMQIVNEHNENVEWYKNNTDAIDAAGDKAREAAASAAAAAKSANAAGEKASQASQSASAAASSQSAASASATAAKKSETNAAASQNLQPLLHPPRPRRRQKLPPQPGMRRPQKRQRNHQKRAQPRAPVMPLPRQRRQEIPRRRQNVRDERRVF